MIIRYVVSLHFNNYAVQKYSFISLLWMFGKLSFLRIILVSLRFSVHLRWNYFLVFELTIFQRLLLLFKNCLPHTGASLITPILWIVEIAHCNILAPKWIDFFPIETKYWTGIVSCQFLDKFIRCQYQDKRKIVWNVFRSWCSLIIVKEYYIAVFQKFTWYLHRMFISIHVRNE